MLCVYIYKKKIKESYARDGQLNTRYHKKEYVYIRDQFDRLLPWIIRSNLPELKLKL